MNQGTFSDYHYYESPSVHPEHDYSRRILMIGQIVGYNAGISNIFGNNPWLANFPQEVIGSRLSKN